MQAALERGQALRRQIERADHCPDPFDDVAETPAGDLRQLRERLRELIDRRGPRDLRALDLRLLAALPVVLHALDLFRVRVRERLILLLAVSGRSVERLRLV